MAEVSNLKIHDRLNVERPNLRVLLRWEMQYQRANLRLSQIASGAEYRLDEQFQNLPIFRILNLEDFKHF